MEFIEFAMVMLIFCSRCRYGRSCSRLVSQYTVIQFNESGGGMAIYFLCIIVMSWKDEKKGRHNNYIFEF